MTRASGIVAAAVLASVFTAASAEAGLIGKTLSAEYDVPTLGAAYSSASFAPASFVVGPGQETDGNVENVTHLLVDFTDHTLTITLRTALSNPTWSTAPFNGPVFTSAGPLGITGATVDPGTTLSGFDNGRISFTSDQIAVNWNGLSYADGTVVKVDFAFVPEPASMTLLATALLGIGLIRSRRPG